MKISLTEAILSLASSAPASMEILTDKQDGVLSITINRPEKKNAITQGMYRALTDALGDLEQDASVNVALIAGSASTFTAGNDVGDFMQHGSVDESAPVFQFLVALSEAKKPLVAAVNGAAVGVGATLLLHCDLVYAGESARFHLPFVPLGLCPEAGSTYLLPAISGYQRAAEKLLLGEPFGAAEARDMGFVTQVFPDGVVLENARVQASKLASLPASSVVTTKALMKRALRGYVAEQLREEATHFRRLLALPEAREAFAAFFARRK